MSAAARGLAVVGAINVDLVVSSERLPRAGETVVGDGPRSFGGGKGANAAVAAARAGAEVVLVGAVGDDQTGAETLARLAAEGVDVGGVARLGEVPTGVALIVVDAAGENQIAVGAGANGALGADAVRTALEPRIAALGCVLVSTEIPDDAVLAAVDVAAAAGVRCVLNPAPPTAAVERSVPRGPLLTPNAGELADLLRRLGEGAPAGEVPGPARALSRLSGAPVIVTRGGDGVLIADADELTELPAPTADVIDTTGAGDTFNGVLAARLAAGDDLRRAAELAVAAASISVGTRGAREGMPTAAEILAAVPA
ncbi:MAG TPA: PfkB family carbohydrate kinase [Solirubrobacterales bacterium]|nr:PfkB family carbohydrate kinase [Solirubrobacterales bacterium]